jgi:two-component system response regulator MprA
VLAADVLVVDDDRAVRAMLERTLRAEGYRVRSAADGGAALVHVERAAPDLVLLDVTMPGLDGLAVCRRIRARGLAIPILLLTARDALTDRVVGLDAGADDYLVKPYAPAELLARLRALLRRASTPTTVLAHGDVSFDVDRRTAKRAGRDLQLTPREADLLERLLANPRGVLSREAALREIWGGDAAATENSVDRYVAYLRRKLGDPPVIETVRGVGYALAR